jgi:2-polyprenyl-3-methyl-5-hydroxy-6-metoxy-1,4-benzoquinol methylase
VIFWGREDTHVSDRPYRLKDDPHSSHGIILARLGEGRQRRVLDVGAADGFLAERLTARGWCVTALERDQELAALARPKCAAVVVADLEEAIPSLSGPFDAVVCGDILEHLSDPEAVLRALSAQVAPGGTVIVSVPNVAHLWVRLSLLFGHFTYTDRGILDRTHLRFFTRRSFLDLLAAGGLRVTELTATPVPLPLLVPPRLHGTWLAAVHGLSAGAARGWKNGLGYQFVAVCHRREPAAGAGSA